MSTATAQTTLRIGDVFSEEQISDLFLTYVRAKKTDTVRRDLLSAIEPMMLQVTENAGVFQPAEAWVKVLEQTFASDAEGTTAI